MKELIKAIVALYAGSSSAAVALRALVNGMWLSQAPQQSTGVYIVMTPVSAPIDYAQSSDATKPFTQESEIQFTFATLTGTTGNVLDAEAAFKTLFHHCSLTMSGQTLLVAKKIGEKGPVRDDDTRGYTMYVTYKFSIGG